MKLHRCAAALTAAAFAPALFVATPAQASNAPVTPQIQKPTVEKPSEVEKLPAVPLAITGDKEVVAGQWHKVLVAVKNPDAAPLSGFTLGLMVGYSGKAAKKGEIQLERHSPDGSWQPLLQPVSHDVETFELQVPTIAANASATVELRLRLATRLIYQDSKSGFIYPWEKQQDPNRTPAGYPFFYFHPLPAEHVHPTPAKPETERPDPDKTGRAKPSAKPETTKHPTDRPSVKPSTPGTSAPHRTSSSAAVTAQPDPAPTGAELATTGAGTALPWVAGGAAVTLAAGAGLITTARRRQRGQH